MGACGGTHHDESEKYTEFIKHYKITEKAKDHRYGQVSYGTHIYIPNTHILVKEIMCRDQEDLLHLTKFLKARKEFKHGSLVGLHDMFLFSDPGFCGAGHKVKIVFDYYPVNLESEIIRRQKITRLDNDHEEKVKNALRF